MFNTLNAKLGMVCMAVPLKVTLLFVFTNPPPPENVAGAVKEPAIFIESVTAE